MEYFPNYAEFRIRLLGNNLGGNQNCGNFNYLILDMK